MPGLYHYITNCKLVWWAMGYGSWAMGYGLWAMGYGLWAMGYGLWVFDPPPSWKFGGAGVSI